MSNHSIGHGLDNVVVTIMELYDNNKIDYESVLQLFSSINKAVWHADGNTYEAFESIGRCRCGKCLKKMTSEEPLYDIYDSEYSDSVYYEIFTEILCKECFDKFISEKENQ